MSDKLRNIAADIETIARISADSTRSIREA